MAKRKFERESVRVTQEWFETKCKPRITDRDERILRFIYDNRLVTSKQVAKLFWRGCSQSHYLADRRLRILYELHCIDRFFPPAPVGEGTNPQHIALDRAGAKVLGLDNFNRLRELPNSYRHHVLAAEFRLRAKLKGFGTGNKEQKVGPIRADIYYPNYNICVEIDRGTETYETLERKAKRYNRLPDKTVVFVTSGPVKRKDRFLDMLTGDNAGTTFDDLDTLLDKMSDKFL